MDAEYFADIVEGDQTGNAELKLEPGAHELPCENLVRDPAPHLEAPGKGGLLDPTRILDRNHHPGIQLFPDAGYRRKNGWRDLPNIFWNRLRVFHEVQSCARIDRVVSATDTLDDMAQGQKSHPLILLVLRQNQAQAANRVDEPGMPMHRPFGLSGGP